MKVNCVLQTLSYGQDSTLGVHTLKLQKPQEHAEIATSTADDSHTQNTIAHPTAAVEPIYHQPAQAPYTDPMRMYQPAPYKVPSSGQAGLQYGAAAPLGVPAQELNYQLKSAHSAPSSASQSAPEIHGLWRSDLNAGGQADALGELRIDYDAVAPYITNQKRTLVEEPALEEYEVHLPQHTCPGRTVRIPPEMMLPERQALYHFDYFFTNIHPYAPILNRAYFYRQWHTNRESISPLLLEAIFACSSLMLGDIEQGKRWLTLASSQSLPAVPCPCLTVTEHEESFKDTPRLSTIQAMLFVMKAREALPKRGYFYRSWMTVVDLVAMAKDLELEEHFELHRLEKRCGSSIYDCAAKARVWHLLFVLEIMIGGAQGACAKSQVVEHS